MKEKVVLALSGGVDSLSAALFLREEFDVIGLHLHTYGDKEDLTLLQEACTRFSVPLYVEDVRKDFRYKVIEKVKQEYIAARTPNICTHCNAELKIPALLSFADKMNIRYVATGHYARLVRNGNNHFIRMAKDRWKDQSYMLYRLSREQRSRLLLPLGERLKQDVKRYAAENGLHDVAAQRESYGLCFTEGKSYSEFLREELPEVDALSGGEVIDERGNKVGTHNGYPFYTIGQWKGLNTTEKLYVRKLIPQSNTIIAGKKEECFAKHLHLKDIHIHQMEKVLSSSSQQRFLIKIRGKDEGTFGFLYMTGNNDKTIDTMQIPESIRIDFEQPVFAPMAGQDAVVYDGQDTIVLGGTIAPMV